jgi:hypothetical protein
VCIAFSSKDNFFHRVMITAVRQLKSGSSMCFFVLVDTGIKKLFKQSELFNILDDFAALPVFCCRVSLSDIGRFVELDGFDELFLLWWINSRICRHK